MENLKISSKNVNSQAFKVCQILRKAGYQAFIVGGCVRDLLLQTQPKDWDICTDASPEKVMELFPKHYPTGLEHGTITVAMDEGIENHFEVTTFRVESEYLDGRRPEKVDFVKDVKQDLARRDLTINAIAFDPISEELVDPFGGIQDLEGKIIRAVGDPNERFHEDGLRIMRVARFAARFGYEIEENTFKGMVSNVKILRKVSKERIKDELCKTLLTKHVFYGINILKDAGILHVTCRSLMNNFDNVDFPPNLHKCSGDLETKIALLYYNISINDAECDFSDLKFSNKEIKRILFQLELLRLFKISENSFNKDCYIDFIAFIKNKSPDTWEYSLNQFITLTEALDIDFKTKLDYFKSVIVFSRKELQINGNDLLGFGVKPGPQIKTILDKCYSEILKYPNNNNLDYLSKFVQTA